MNTKQRLATAILNMLLWVGWYYLNGGIVVTGHPPSVLWVVYGYFFGCLVMGAIYLLE